MRLPEPASSKEKHEVEQIKREAARGPETRAQRRDRERRNEEARKAIESLQGQFLNFFMEAENPEGKEVVQKMEQIDAKWRVFCKNKNLIPNAYPVMREWMEVQLSEYLKEKDRKNTVGKEFNPEAIATD